MGGVTVVSIVAHSLVCLPLLGYSVVFVLRIYSLVYRQVPFRIEQYSANPCSPGALCPPGAKLH